MTKTLLAVCFAVFGIQAFSAELLSVKTAGESSAEVSFHSDEALTAVPRLSFDDNRIELTFSNLKISPALQPEALSPHALIQKISLSPVEGGSARVRIVVNGSIAKLRDRVRLQKNDKGVTLSLAYPVGSEATLKLLQEEQATLDPKKNESTQQRAGFGWFRWVLSIFLLAAAGVGTWAFVRFAKKKVGWRGSRKHLIETVAGTTLGDGKASVAILRVGGEFVMVGVTSQQVSFLSHLPKLQAQYEMENSLERDSFNEAISEELRRARPGLSV
jgi:flagellar biogenesis protein FliO